MEHTNSAKADKRYAEKEELLERFCVDFIIAQTAEKVNTQIGCEISREPLQ